MWLNQRKADTPLAVRGPQNPVAPAATSALSAPSESPAAVSRKTPDRPDTAAAGSGAFQGTWTISEAETLTDTPYSGTVQILGKKERYEVKWRTTASDTSGIGLANGNQLCVAWGQEELGVVIYKLAPDGKLKGKWIDSSAASDKNVGLENATGGSPGEIAGEYDVKGMNPAGESYEGTLTIEKTGKTYQLEWDIGGNSTKGVGIESDDTLFVAWAVKEPVGVILYNFDGPRAKGVWTLAGESETATENLAK